MGKNHSYACDVWGLGMLLYELLLDSMSEVKVETKRVEMKLEAETLS